MTGSELAGNSVLDSDMTNDGKNTDELEQESSRVEIARAIKGLSQEQWSQLGLYQHFHQALFENCLSMKYLETEEEGLGSCLRDELKSRVKSSLETLEARLFEVTAPQLIEELINAHWLTAVNDELDLDEKRATQLSSQLSINDAGELEITVITPAPTRAEERQRKADEREAKRIARREERLRESLQYINPLDHISYENETPFTIRRLDLILTSLDGLVLRQESVRELLKMSKDDFKLVFDATDRLGLTHRDEDGYVRLDFYGSSIARQDRAPRLKTLAMMASRLRREQVLRESSSSNQES